MPVYEVISGEIDGTNGHSPKKKRVRARDALRAAWYAHVIGGGRIDHITPVGQDLENREYMYQAVSTKKISFAIHVQELTWYDRWKKFFGY